MKELNALNKYFIKYKWHFIGGIVFVMISNWFRVLQPQMLRQALDLVTDNINLYGLFDGFERQIALKAILGKTIMVFSVVVLILALLMGVFMYFMRQTIIVMSRLVEYDVRKELFLHYEKLDSSFYKRNNTGDMMARITEDVSKIRMYIGPAMLYGFNLVSLFVLVVWSMMKVNVELTLYSLAPLPLLSISIYYVSTTINKKSEEIQKQLAKLNVSSQEVFSGIRVIKSYVQEKASVGFFGNQSQDYLKISLSRSLIDSSFYPVMLLLIGASTIITVYVGGLQVAKGNITPGNIAEFVIYVNMLTWPVTAIGWIASLTQQAAASQKRLNEFLEIKPIITNPINEKKKLRGDIQFENVTFVYPDTGIKAINNLSFALRAGEKMAIIGRTGSGKSTIADLILRMYDVSDGVIKIDNEDIRTLDLANLRQKIGYVPQDVFLFSDSVAGNIAFGKRDASREEIENYARYAAVYDDIMGLPNGFDTMVGERGVTLSGGQKQRVSIARAFIKQPDIVLLDDCLSAVDTNTEQQILSYLNNVIAHKTAIIITHRIYSSLQFDKIIVIDNGTIVESGTHESLLNNGGYYAELFEQQKMITNEVTEF